MTGSCPECGAKLPAGASLEKGTSCDSIFESFLALEFSDPAYGEVHFLTVACFMIQHGRYSDAGMDWIEAQLRAYLEEDLTAEELRRRAARGVGQDLRTWKVTRQPGEPPLPKVNWSITITDVAANYRDAESYRDWVKRWAHKTLEEMNR